MDQVFVDADVLAAAVPRSILYYGAALPGANYKLTYSPHTERQAEQNQSAKQIPISELRKRLGWSISDDVANVKTFKLVDTAESDEPILAAAISARAKFIVTGNVKDFGEADLKRHRISAVHPGLFLAHRLTTDHYSTILNRLGATRRREPKSPLGIHEHDVANELPQLFARYRNLFGEPNPYQPRNPPRLDFRGWERTRFG